MAETHERARLVLALFDQYYERVYAFLRKSSAPDVAEDLAQEVFVRLLQHPALERLTISISYLLKIAHNLLRRRYARAARLRELLHERAVMQVCDDPPRMHAKMRSDDGEMQSDLLETALGLLARDEQDAIRLIVCEGKTYQHAAEALGVSVTTINNWKHRGVVKLRKLVGAPAESSAAEDREQVVGLRKGRSTRGQRIDLSADRGPSAIRQASPRGGQGRARSADEVA